MKTTTLVKYRIGTWYNSKTNNLQYTVEGKTDGGEWVNVCEGKKALFFDTRKDALSYKRSIQ